MLDPLCLLLKVRLGDKLGSCPLLQGAAVGRMELTPQAV